MQVRKTPVLGPEPRCPICGRLPQPLPTAPHKVIKAGIDLWLVANLVVTLMLGAVILLVLGGLI
jgi:hypothetical protein